MIEVEIEGRNKSQKEDRYSHPGVVARWRSRDLTEISQSLVDLPEDVIFLER
jgi:hypothetical protein